MIHTSNTAPKDFSCLRYGYPEQRCLHLRVCGDAVGVNAVFLVDGVFHILYCILPGRGQNATREMKIFENRFRISVHALAAFLFPDPLQALLGCRAFKANFVVCIAKSLDMCAHHVLRQLVLVDEVQVSATLENVADAGLVDWGG